MPTPPREERVLLACSSVAPFGCRPWLRRPLAIGLVLIALPLPSFASSYEALCGTTACTISLDATGISSPAGFIPTPRIAQWFTGGQEDYNAGAGTAGALGGATLAAIGGGLLLGPIGLLGGLIGGGIAGAKAGKTADLFFNVVGYTQDGKKTTLSFRFVNPKPANRMKTELPMFTGLAMGQTRSLEDLRAAMATPLGSASAAALPDQLDLSPAARPLPTTPMGSRSSTLGTAPTGRSAPAGVTSASVLPERLDATPSTAQMAISSTPQVSLNQDEQWQAYLKARGLEQWAASNPEMAARLRQRLFPAP